MRWDEERLDMLINETLLDTLLSPEGGSDIEETNINVPSQKMAFLKEGIEHKYYRIGQEVNGKGYVVLYRPPERRQWLRIGKFTTREKAQQQLNQFIEKLTQISISSEGFHTIEHILLRPDPQINVFGFKIFDERGLLLLQQHDWMPFNKRAEVLESIIAICQRIRESGDYSLFAELDGLCQINLGQDSNYTWLVTPKTLQQAYREQLDSFVKRVIYTVTCLQEQQTTRYPVIKKTVSYSKEIELDEHFFLLKCL